MKAYVVTSGAIFALLTLAHILRIVLETRRLLTEPAYLLITLASAALAVWAWRIWRRLNRTS